MSLSELLVKTSNNGHSPPLARLCPKSLQHTDDVDTFKYLYNSSFNDYCLELTISPKSSPRLQREACCACGATSLRDLKSQQEIMINLIEELINIYKINILGVIELYKDEVNLHVHCLINNQKEHKIKKIKKHIKNYYQLDNKSIVNIQPVKSKQHFRDYLIKEPYDDWFYYNEHNERPIEFIEREVKKLIKSRKNLCTCKIIQCQFCKDLDLD